MKRVLSSFLFLIVVFLIIFNQTQPSGAAPQFSQGNGFGPWQITTIDSQNNVGGFLSMAVKWDTKTPHIAYYDATAGDLKLAVQTPGNCGPNNSWNCTILDGVSSSDVGQYVSLAFRNDYKYGVAYFDAVNGVNRFTSPGVGINGEVIEYVAGETVGLFNALVYDSANIPHIAYKRDMTGGVGLGYAKRVSSGGNCSVSWNCQIIHNVGQYISIDRQQFTGLGIAYSAIGGYLAFAHPVSSGGNCGSGLWICENIQPAGVVGSSVQLARCGLLSCSTQTMIAYFDYISQQLRLVEYVGNNMGNCLDKDWRCITIETVGQTQNFDALGLSLLIKDNEPVIVYQDLNDQANGIVKVAYEDSNGNCGPNNSWRCDVIDDGFRGSGFVSVGKGLDAEFIDGLLHVAYHDASFGDLLMAVEGLPTPPPPPPTPPPPTTSYTVYLPMARR